ncbi:beta-glucosidase-like SFR2, chloroplastic [Iris pallida]|uniref:Beta-glucosidase-like SFR2, chloroplastic n=1 Tax=Iris pallida TaxID=29817 RepID=A0AAX6E841_IRIPA|nr:beta-glucosidase-like SFR2, chloroplastic [Iris pallida]
MNIPTSFGGEQKWNLLEGFTHTHTHTHTHTTHTWVVSYRKTNCCFFTRMWPVFVTAPRAQRGTRLPRARGARRTVWCVLD